MKERNTHIEELISTFLAKGLEQSEQEELNAWISRSEANRKYFMQCQDIWFSATQKEDRRYNSEKAFKIFQKRVARQKYTEHRTLKWKIAYRYAAVALILGLVSYFSYWSGENNLQRILTNIEVEAPLGSQTRLRLPDGTKIVLNAGSRIIYSQDFGIDNREVELIGEGYFEVAHNEKIHFHVSTKDLQVKVLGTKFNIRDYPEDTQAVVSLLEGKVALDNRMQAKNEIILFPNEQVTLDKRNGCMRKEAKMTTPAIEWTMGKLTFDETPLPEVARILERNYGVDIIFSEDSLKDFRIYGSFNRSEQNIKDILEVLEKTEKIHYTVKNKQITLY